MKTSITLHVDKPEYEGIYRDNMYLLGSILNEVAKETEIDSDFVVSLSMVTSDRIQDINKEHRDKDKPTDVLSFPQMETFEGETDMGDIFINHDLLKQQAEEIGTDEHMEFLYQFMHGLLHLIGYDHETDEEYKEMRDREKEIFSKLGIRDE